MPTELYKQWTTELINYKPTNSQLRQTLYGQSKYCCLGVACEISKLGKWIEDEYEIEDCKDRLLLPEQVRVALGLATSNGLFHPSELSAALFNKINTTLEDEHKPAISDNLIHSLTDLNDSLGNYTQVFTLIQAILQEAPPSLFIKEPSTEGQQSMIQ